MTPQETGLDLPASVPGPPVEALVRSGSPQGGGTGDSTHGRGFLPFWMLSLTPP